jgi:hypothetical protein
MIAALSKTAGGSALMKAGLFFCAKQEAGANRELGRAKPRLEKN